MVLIVTACSDGGDRAAPSNDTTERETTGSSAGETDRTDGDGSTSTDATTGTTGTTPDEAPELAMVLSAPEIWASTGDAAVCSPVEPSSSRLEVRPSTEVALVGVVMEMPNGGRRHLVLVPGDDGVWSADVGPIRARRGMADTDLELRVVAFDDAAVAEFGLELVGVAPADLEASGETTGVASGAGLDVGALGALADVDLPDGADLRAVQLADIEFDLERATATDDTALTVLAPTACRSGQTRDRVTRSKDVPELGIELTAGDGAELWAGGPQVCPAGSTTVTLSARTTGKVDGVRMRWTLPNGATGTKAMRRGASGDGSWTAELGPFNAAKSMPDSSDAAVALVARDPDGNEVEVSTVVSIRRPAACDADAASAGPGGSADDENAASSASGTSTPGETGTDGTTGNGTGGRGNDSTTSSAPVTPGGGADAAVTVDATVGAGEIWATADGLCGSGASTAVVEAKVGAEVDGVIARVTLATGSEVASVQLVSLGSGVWRGTIGPVAADRNMPASSVLTVRVTARRGERSASDTATLTLRRPAPCASATTSPAAPTTPAPAGPDPTTPATPATPVAPTPTTPATANSVAPTVDATVSAAQIWAVGDGLCGGASTVTVGANVTGTVDGVRARVTAATGVEVASFDLARSGSQWRGTLGPIAAWRDMPASGVATIRVQARSGSRSIEDSVTVTLRRPDRCPPTTVAPVPTPPPVTVPPVTAPPVTAAPVTVPPTAAPTIPPPTTAAPTTAAPVALTIDGRAGATAIGAVADGLCPRGSTTITVEARTTGQAADVQVRAVGGNGSTLATVALANQGGGVWRATLGPIAGNRDMPDSSTLTLQFGVRGPGGSPTAADSETITLLRSAPCA